MGINSNVFQSNPVSLDVSRSKLSLSHSWTGTFNTGLAVPILSYCDVLPGDTFKLGMSMVIRSTTPIAPVMDNAFADVYFFFVPHKLTLSRKSMSPDVNDSNHSWAAIVGAQDNLLNMPLPDDGAELPVTYFDDYGAGHWKPGSLSDYIGMPSHQGMNLDLNSATINCLEPLAYYAVWNNYFRDPNTMNPVTYSISSNGGVNDSTQFYGGPHNWEAHRGIGDVESVLPVCRDHGYFGSALPWPQRNSVDVTLPLGDYADIVATTDLHDMGAPLKLAPETGVFLEGKPLVTGAYGSDSSKAAIITAGTDNMALGSGSASNITRTNLRADLSTAVAANVNALRATVQTQRWYEALARGGNRIQDVTGMFGVRPHDMGDDRPEYLGGRRIPIVIQQVTNTAGTQTSTTTQYAIGSTGAFSLTTDESSYFTKSFDTWGTIIGIICVRIHDSFHQGLPRRYSRRNKFDFYWPQFANLGEQPILNKEIYFSSDDVQNEKVFGYQEAWAEYRFFPNMVTGLARPGKNQAYWTYCNNFDSLPTLAGFLNASSQKTNVDETLQIKSISSGFQWMANIYFDITAVRPMPLYSLPGLVDHH